MKSILALVALVAASIGTAAAQGSGGTSSPVTTQPNYAPGGGTKNKAKTVPGQVTQSGGQGHNSTPSPKGKVLVAPTAPTKNKKNTTSSNTKTGTMQ